MVESGALDGYDVVALVANNAVSTDTVKFNSSVAVSKLFSASATILSATSIVFVATGTSAASALIDSILNASASAAVVLRDYSSVVAATISTTTWMIQRRKRVRQDYVKKYGSGGSSHANEGKRGSAQDGGGSSQ